MTIDEQIEKIMQISAVLEKGDLPLEEALKKYEEGVKLVRECSGQINKVKKSIEIIETGDAEDEL